MTKLKMIWVLLNKDDLKMKGNNSFYTVRIYWVKYNLDVLDEFWYESCQVQSSALPLCYDGTPINEMNVVLGQNSTL